MVPRLIPTVTRQWQRPPRQRATKLHFEVDFGLLEAIAGCRRFIESAGFWRQTTLFRDGSAVFWRPDHPFPRLLGRDRISSATSWGQGRLHRAHRGNESPGRSAPGRRLAGVAEPWSVTKRTDGGARLAVAADPRSARAGSAWRIRCNCWRRRLVSRPPSLAAYRQFDSRRRSRRPRSLQDFEQYRWRQTRRPDRRHDRALRTSDVGPGDGADRSGTIGKGNDPGKSAANRQISALSQSHRQPGGGRIYVPVPCSRPGMRRSTTSVPGRDCIQSGLGLPPTSSSSVSGRANPRAVVEAHSAIASVAHARLEWNSSTDPTLPSPRWSGSGTQ